jgi:uncharacterized protein Yka (UPF0111/DUF47 family)
MGDRKAVIKNADMGEEMQQDAVDCATQALEKYNIEKVSNFPRTYTKLFAKGLKKSLKTSHAGTNSTTSLNSSLNDLKTFSSCYCHTESLVILRPK